jgi:hypothetical protein
MASDEDSNMDYTYGWKARCLVLLDECVLWARTHRRTTTIIGALLFTNALPLVLATFFLTMIACGILAVAACVFGAYARKGGAG